jgi:hypothetical protein
VRDLDGDGLSEIVCREGEKLMALRHVPERAWRTPAFDGPERARMTVEGEVLIQDDEGLHRVDAQGGIHETSMSVPGSLRYLAGTVTAKDGAELTVFEGLWDPTPLLEHDLNGDGVPEIIVPARSGLVAYDLEGNEVLRIEGRDVSFEAAAGDLDGKGGDELVLFVQQYGLVALGHSGGVVARR